jgi:hypothetical protein
MLLVWLCGINVAVLVASNAAGAKIIALPFGLAASATAVSYALTFTITDIISEVYGRKSATLAVRLGFFGVVIGVIFFSIAIAAPAAPGWEGQQAFETTLGLAPRLLVGGLIAYLISQHLDVYIFHLVRRLTSGRHLWLRNNLSTAVSQLVDTVIFAVITFWGLYPVVPIIFGQYIIKIVIALVDTPLVYLLTATVRKFLGRTDTTPLEDVLPGSE